MHGLRWGSWGEPWPLSCLRVGNVVHETTRCQHGPSNPSHDGLINGLESIQNANFGGFSVNFGPKEHVASRYVDLSMLTEDGKVRR